MDTFISDLVDELDNMAMQYDGKETIILLGRKERDKLNEHLFAAAVNIHRSIYHTTTSKDTFHGYTVIFTREDSCTRFLTNYYQ